MLVRPGQISFIKAQGLAWSLLLLVGTAPAFTQPREVSSATTAEQELFKISKQKWDWMSERNGDALSALFDERAVFVDMGATMSKTQEFDVIKSGTIQYKKADIQEASVRFVGTTAIVLTKMNLLAVVGGHEVTIRS